MKIITLYNGSEQIVVNAGSRKEAELRKAGWSAKKAASKPEPKSESGKQEPGNQQPSGEGGGTVANS